MLRDIGYMKETVCSHSNKLQYYKSFCGINRRQTIVPLIRILYWIAEDLANDVHTAKSNTKNVLIHALS